MIRIVQFSDIHLNLPKAEQKVRKAAKMVNKLKADVVVFCGDMTSDGYLREYKKAVSLFKLFKPSPIVVPGNHDARHAGQTLFRRFFPRLPLRKEVSKKLVVYAVDTTLPDVDPGMIGAGVFKWIQENSEKDSHKYKVVVLHHHILPVPHTGRERNVLYDAGDALSVLISCNINLVLSGHKHVPNIWLIEGLATVNSPATASPKVILDYKNAFNVVDVDDGKVRVEMHNLDGTKQLLAKFSTSPKTTPKLHTKCIL
ncbi:MAG: metallophosphoesterase family protein [Candidatus Micrarchaeia archaeon]